MWSFRVTTLPQAQARPRFATFQAGVRTATRTYSPKTSFYHAALWQARASRPRGAPLDCPLALSVLFVFPRPKSTPKYHTWKATKPDTDNLVKGLKDAMTTAGWWKDDGRVAHEVVSKVWAQPGQQACARVRVVALPPDGETPRL